MHDIKLVMYYIAMSVCCNVFNGLAKCIWNNLLIFSLLFFVATYDSCALVEQCLLLCNVGKYLGSEMPLVRCVDVSNIMSV